MIEILGVNKVVCGPWAFPIVFFSIKPFYKWKGLYHFASIECQNWLLHWLSFFLPAYSAQTDTNLHITEIISFPFIFIFCRWRALFQWCSLLWKWDNAAHLWYPVFLCCGSGFPKFYFSRYSNILATRGKF